MLVSHAPGSVWPSLSLETRISAAVSSDSVHTQRVPEIHPSLFSGLNSGLNPAAIHPRLTEALEEGESRSSTQSLLLFAFPYIPVPRALKEQSKQYALARSPYLEVKMLNL